LTAEYLAEMLARTVIIGNSGSGKSHLAKSLATIYSAPLVQLDQLFWMPGGFNEQRPKDEIKNEIERKRKDSSWIVEGVFGELAELFLPSAQSLIFLDLDWTVCRAGLLARGSESSKQLETAKAEENFEKLLLWAEQYRARTNSCSHSGHLQLFSNFAGQKFKFTRRAEVNEFLKRQKIN
jgi:adenylate kinase family enzyme